MSTYHICAFTLSEQEGGTMMKLMQTRRDFLKLAGKVLAGGAAVAAAPVLIPTAEAASGNNMATAGIIRGKVTDTNSCMMPAVILVEAADGTAYRACKGCNICLGPHRSGCGRGFGLVQEYACGGDCK